MTEIFTKPQVLELVKELKAQFGLNGAAKRLRIDKDSVTQIIEGKSSLRKVLLRLGLTTVYIRKKELLK